MRINLTATMGRIIPPKLQQLLMPLLARADIILSSDHPEAASQRMALITFIIRVMSAVVAFVSQVLLARWMGSFEYGVFVAVWVAIIIMGTIVSMGFPSAAIRFVAEYRETKQNGLLNGIVRRSVLICFLTSTFAAAIGALGLLIFPDRVTDHYVMPIFLAMVCLPMLAVQGVLDAIARAHNWPNVAFLPTFIVRPIGILLFMVGAILLGFPSTAVTTMTAAILASYLSTLSQLFVLIKRLKKVLPKTEPEYKTGYWIFVALPIFLVEGFYVLMTSVDILFVSAMIGPEETAVYFASAKILALVHFVYFAVRAAVSHKYTEYYTAGQHGAFQDFVQKTVSWTFWPSLVLGTFMVFAGKYFLMLFGSEFVAGQHLIPILVAGIVIRASIGPAEALLVMADKQLVCAMIFGVTLFFNVVLNLTLIPIYGITGAALATSMALLFETAALHSAAKRILDIHAFVIPTTSGYRSVEG